jgi:chromosome partitioning protein
MDKLIENGIVVSIGSPKSDIERSVLLSLIATCIHLKWRSKVRILVVDCYEQDGYLYKQRKRELEIVNNNFTTPFYLVNISSEIFPYEVEFLRDEYDIIFIDLPANLNQQTLIQCYNLVDVLIVPTKVNSLDLLSTIDFLRRYKKTIVQTRENIELKTAIYGLFSGLDLHDNDFHEKNFEEFCMSLPIEFLQNFVPESETSTQRERATSFVSENLNYANYEDLSREILNKLISGVGGSL